MLFGVIYAMCHEPVYIWDEAIYANNSVEMARHGHWLVYTRNGLPDHYNSKPPLAIWMQAISFRLFSYHEFFLRLPTLLALLGLSGLVYRFCLAHGLTRLTWALVSLILLSTPGLIRPHVFLTGDLDGLLVFFTTGLCLEVLTMAKKRTITDRSVYVAYFFLLGGFMTKSVAVFLLAPSLLLILSLHGLLLPLFRMKSFYVGILAFLVLAGTYYTIREYLDPGYLSVVWQSEIMRYTSKVMSWHAQPFSFYLEQIILRFNPYYAVITILLGSAWLYVVPGSPYRGIVLNSFIICFVYLLIISIPAVKLEWYDAPLYTIWSLGLGIMVYDLFEWMMSGKQQLARQLLCVTAMALLFCYPCYHLFAKQFFAKRVFLPQEIEAACLKQIDRQFHLDHYKVLMDVEDQKIQHFDVLNFYIQVFAEQQHKNVELIRSVNMTNPGDTLIVTQQDKCDSLALLFHTDYFPGQKAVMVLGGRR